LWYERPTFATIPARVLGPYRHLLGVPGARRLLVSSLAGRLPLGMASLAVLLLVRAATGSFAVAGVAVGAFALAQAVAAPVLGALVDRSPMPAVLLPSAALQFAALVGLVLAARWSAPAAVLVALSAAGGATQPPVAAAVRMLWARVAPEPRLRDAAYALDASAQEVVWTTGPLLVGGAIALVSPSAAVLLTAVVSLAGTWWFTSGALARSAPPATVAGRASALTSAGLRALLVAGGLLGLSIGATEVGLAGLADHDGAAAAGVLLSVWSVGSLVGGLAYGAMPWRSPLDRRLPALLAALGVLCLPLIAAEGFAAGVVVSFVAGLCIAPVFSCLYSLTAEHAPAGTTAEAFTWSTAALVTGIAAGSAVAGALVEAAGVPTAMTLGPTACIVAAALAFAHRRRLAAPAFSAS
jgi:MFS family permease